MNLTSDELVFLRELAMGRDQFLSVLGARIDVLEKAGLIRVVRHEPLKVAITGIGRKKIEEI